MYDLKLKQLKVPVVEVAATTNDNSSDHILLAAVATT